MIPPRIRLGTTALVLAVASALLVGCAPDASPAPSESVSTAPTPSATATEPVPEASASVEPVGDPTCEAIIPEDTVNELGAIGWTVRADSLYIGALEVPEGLQCVWADFAGPAGDHLLIFGWGPIEDAEATAAQDELVSQGWVREEAETGVYITENPETTIATDADGYGMTYFFGDGWVKLADTKQGLLLITWPPA
ncbi:hypothetical protein LG299_03285 [Microbacterium lacus]|uniref:hypothetical protein n=1 Tax=Microbacterium lacus TaxID=415217 RepID=UPI00384DA6C6